MDPSRKSAYPRDTSIARSTATTAAATPTAITTSSLFFGFFRLPARAGARWPAARVAGGQATEPLSSPFDRRGSPRARSMLFAITWSCYLLFIEYTRHVIHCPPIIRILGIPFQPVNGPARSRVTLPLASRRGGLQLRDRLSSQLRFSLRWSGKKKESRLDDR